MEVVEKYKEYMRKPHLGHFPKGHVFAVSSLAICLLVFSIVPSNTASAKRQTSVIEVPITQTVAELEDKTPFSDSQPKHDNALQQKVVEVSSGDNLSLIFRKAGLNDASMMALLNGHKESKRLTSLYPGHKLEFSTTPEDTLHKLTYVVDKLNSFSFTKTNEGFRFDEHSRTPDVRYAQSSAFITHSLYTAGIDARLDDKLIMELADIFGWDVDFALDIRKGDHFKVVYEEKFIDGEKIGNGSIIAAEFVNQGESFQAVRYENARGEVGYYAPGGKSMKKEFLRAPLDFRRISSNFNPRRLHPIMKTLRPHRGIDYAAATGTPVWSSGNGRVIESGYSKANGNYVVIQHGNSIQTKYLHLHKRHVKTGQKVKQKQKIGTVGSTGLATGPHLHYEFLISGVHRNPRTIINRLPKAKSVSPGELPRFVKHTRGHLAQLNEDFSPTRYAKAPQEPQTKSL